MAYSAYAVANAFIRKAKEGRLRNLSPMKLQKLMYYAQAWHLRVTGEPLLDDTFKRWQHGPVIPSIYHEFRAFGYSPIDREATTLSMSTNGDVVMHVPTVPEDDQSVWSLVDAIIDRYGKLPATTLSAMTHQPGSAWAQGGPDGSEITTEQIKTDATV